MVAHDDAGGLLPIKRTIRVIDAQNQSFREQEVRAGARVPRRPGEGSGASEVLRGVSGPLKDSS